MHVYTFMTEGQANIKGIRDDTKKEIQDDTQHSRRGKARNIPPDSPELDQIRKRALKGVVRVWSLNGNEEGLFGNVRPFDLTELVPNMSKDK